MPSRPKKNSKTKSPAPSKSTKNNELAQWTEEDLQNALSAVRAKGPTRLSVKMAAQTHRVPRTTLRRYVKGQAVGAKAGRSSALSFAEYEALVEDLIDRSQRGIPATRTDLVAMIIDVTSDGRRHQFGPSGPTPKWISSFLVKHSDRLAVRKARILDSARVKAADKTELEYFFEEYQDFLSRFPLSPAQIYNCDETGVDPQGGMPKKVISKKGAKEVAVQRGQDRENTSVLMAVSATGVCLPPLFIFKGTEFPSDLLHGAPPGSKGTVTPNGFIDCGVFEQWIDHFIENIPVSRPVLLTLDNHISHVGLPVRRKCIANGIHLLSFPPHTTHLLQPVAIPSLEFC